MKKWLKVGLSWGLTMYILMVFLFPFFGREEITLKKVLIGVPFWLFGGVVFGLTMKKSIEKSTSYPKKSQK